LVEASSHATAVIPYIRQTGKMQTSNAENAMKQEECIRHVKKTKCSVLTCMTDVVCMFCSMHDAKQISLKPYEP